MSIEDYLNKKSLLKVQEDNLKIIKKPGEIFGDSEHLNEEKMQRSYLIAKTEVRCFEIG